MKYQPHKLTEKQKKRCRQILRSLDHGDLTFGWGNTEEGMDYWVTAIDKLRAKIKHGTSDGKPWVEPEPPIPEGYRKANKDEWQRTDVKFWLPALKEWRPREHSGTEFDPPSTGTRYIVPCRPPVPEGWRVASEDEYHRSDIKTWEGSHDGDRGHWRVRPGHKAGRPFNGPNYLYIVPIDPPLTDQDARTRPWIMVKNSEEEQWRGPYSYMAKDEREQDLHCGCFWSNEKYLVLCRDGSFEWFCDARRATPEEIKEQLQ